MPASKYPPGGRVAGRLACRAAAVPPRGPPQHFGVLDAHHLEPLELLLEFHALTARGLVVLGIVSLYSSSIARNSLGDMLL